MSCDLDVVVKHGLPVRQAIAEIAKHPTLRLITLGDSHKAGHSFRHWYSIILEDLINSDFKCDRLALQFPDTMQDAFDAYVTSETSMADLQEEFLTKGYSELFNFNAATQKYDLPAPDFFAMIEVAKRYELVVCTVDKAVDDVSRSRLRDDDPRIKSRDLHMANRFIEYWHDGSRVVLWGGYKHHYTRKTRGIHKTAVEMVREGLGDSVVFSILGLMQTDRPNNEIEKLIPQLKESVLIKTSDCRELAAIVEGEERRCDNGSCERLESGSAAVSSCRLGKSCKSTDTRVPIRYGDWDAVLIASN